MKKYLGFIIFPLCLAGLSAATVMVPMLIVICPSFSGEIGAYQAAAVSPASAKTTVSAGKPIDVIDLRDPPADREVPIEETMPPYEPISNV